MTVADLPFLPRFAVTDVSFISLRLILPPIVSVLPPASKIISLIKPQFEAGREHTPRGVVRDPAIHQQVVDTIRDFAQTTLRLECLGIERSPLLGPEGNVEFLALWQTP
jgi:23S rRNA (cytidine1920-2'-O)/16S rRNA (cytidine1409-2'-O)-methyltransferase